MYRMVARRTAMTYDRLEQLIEENFTIYLRSHKPAFEFHKLALPIKWSFRKRVSYGTGSDLDLSVFVLSEVESFLAFCGSKFEKYILKMARLHNKAQLELKTIVLRAYNTFKELKIEELYLQKVHHENTSSLFINTEENILLHELNNSIILPRYSSLQYAVKLSNRCPSSVNFVKVQIGKEKYFKQYY